MKLSLDIVSPSSQEWVDKVMANFDDFLIDHADCERKASSMMMSFVAKYPDRTKIIPLLIESALEELEHFQSVYALMEKRGIKFPHTIPKDPYVKKLLNLAHNGRDERFMDRLLISSVVETRGAERFRRIEEAIVDDPEMKRFYKELWACEAKHGNIFVEMALEYFDEKTVYDRLEWWIQREDEIINSMEIRAAMH